MILLDFLDHYPLPVKYLFGKPFHLALLITKTYTPSFSQELINNWLKYFGSDIQNQKSYFRKSRIQKRFQFP